MNISIKENLNNITFFNILSEFYSDIVNKSKNSNIIKRENLPQINNTIFKDSILDIKNLIEIY